MVSINHHHTITNIADAYVNVSNLINMLVASIVVHKVISESVEYKICPRLDIIHDMKTIKYDSLWSVVEEIFCSGVGKRLF